MYFKWSFWKITSLFHIYSKENGWNDRCHVPRFLELVGAQGRGGSKTRGADFDRQALLSNVHSTNVR